MPYFGGKSAAGFYQRIINLIPPHRLYVEPFVGGGAILRLKKPAEWGSVVCDLDPKAIEAFARDQRRNWRCELSTPIPALSTRVGCGIEFLEHCLGLWRSGLPLTYVDGDAVPWSQVFVYCDPPYVHATRGATRYRHEMTDAQHVRLLEVLTALPCPVLLSGYPSDLYAAHGFTPAPSAVSGACGRARGRLGLPSTWSVDVFPAMTRGHSWRIECLWRNYERPAVLHDVRYVGSNFRERWRIEKRRRRWRARVEKLDPHERGALLAALLDVVPDAELRGAISARATPFLALPSGAIAQRQERRCRDRTCSDQAPAGPPAAAQPSPSSLRSSPDSP